MNTEERKKQEAEYEPVADHAHTCGECVRYTENWRQKGQYRCCACYGPGDGLPAGRKACKAYWDKAEEERSQREEAEERERERKAAWEKNYSNSPRPAVFQRDIDFCTGKPTGAMPFCPNCSEPLYDLERCYFCGQAIEQNKALEDWAEPPKVETMDCFHCGGKGTLQYTKSKYNGHKSGGCTVCGMRFIE